METTLGASLRLVDSGLRHVALNFAKGIHPGGHFLNGAKAQEKSTLSIQHSISDTG
jgi:uncharacterized protein (TIGR02452 family)